MVLGSTTVPTSPTSAGMRTPIQRDRGLTISTVSPILNIARLHAFEFVIEYLPFGVAIEEIDKVHVIIVPYVGPCNGTCRAFCDDLTSNVRVLGKYDSVADFEFALFLSHDLVPV